MVKVRITDQGIIEEAGDGFEIQTATRNVFTPSVVFSGSVDINTPVTSSQGLVCRTSQSGSGPHFALTVTGSEGSSAASCGIMLWSTGSNTGTNTGYGQTVPTGACLIFWDQQAKKLKIKDGATVRKFTLSAT